MPFRDHFGPPLDNETSWEGLHGGWPMIIVAHLTRTLPRRYVAEPRVYLGTFFEIDVSGYEKDVPGPPAPGPEEESEGGVATATWAPPRPTLDVATDLPEQDEYEVRVYDSKRHRRLVAAVEIVSPANKDRPENRRAFVAKCAALLQQRVSVAIVDLVTIRHFNLYVELLDFIGQVDPTLSAAPSPLYAAACRWKRNDDSRRLQGWAHALVMGQPLPTLPLWLTDSLAVPLELEASYEETCQILRIA